MAFISSEHPQVDSGAPSSVAAPNLGAGDDGKVAAPSGEDGSWGRTDAALVPLRSERNMQSLVKVRARVRARARDIGLGLVCQQPTGVCVCVRERETRRGHSERYCLPLLGSGLGFVLNAREVTSLVLGHIRGHTGAA